MNTLSIFYHCVGDEMQCLIHFKGGGGLMELRVNGAIERGLLLKSVRAIAPHRAPSLLGTKTAVNGIIVLSVDGGQPSNE